MSTYVWSCDICVFVDAAYEPEAVPKWTDRETCDGEVKVGDGIQGLPGLGRWLHEYAGNVYDLVL